MEIRVKDLIEEIIKKQKDEVLREKRLEEILEKMIKDCERCIKLLRETARSY